MDLERCEIYINNQTVIDCDCGRFSGATTENLPPGVLYRVRATYKYTAEDDDELALEVGDIVQVVEYEDPEELVRSPPPLLTSFFFPFLTKFCC